MAGEWTVFERSLAVQAVRTPSEDEDKYARGVVGFVTGSDRYPGAAVLGVEGAAHAGAGMVRYLGPAGAAAMVLARRPETVTADGRVQAWVIGSGTDPHGRAPAETKRMRAALAEDVVVVIDAGALDLAQRRSAPTILTPHARELAGLLQRFGIEVDAAAVASDPALWCERAVAETGCTVLLKGHTTHVAEPAGDRVRGYSVTAPTTWLGTAGSGDVLAGIVGALLVGRTTDTVGVLEAVAAAVWIHGHAGADASGGGPLVALDIARAVPAVIAALLGSERNESGRERRG